MKKQPIQLLSYLMILFSLLTTSLYAAADNVNSITGPATIQHGESVTLNVDYEASEARHLVAYLKRTTGEKKNRTYYYKRVIVQAGSATKQFTFTVPANAPTNETYKYGTYIAPVGKYFKDNLGKAYQQDVQVESDGGVEDDVNSISGPATIKHGESVTLNVDYLASQKRDLVVYLKSTTDTKRKSEVYIRREVDAGSETEQFTFTVPDDAPTDETYKYGVYIAPVDGKFGDNLGKAYQQNVHVQSADSVENPALTREQLQALVAEWKANPTQENADAISNANVSQITDMSDLFKESRFNAPLDKWDVSNVTNMSGMFAGEDMGDFGSNYTYFNQPIGNWDVSNVTDMSNMFDIAAFSRDIGNWDVSSVTNMSGMFGGKEWAGEPRINIGNWDVSNVTDMSGMFSVRDWYYGGCRSEDLILGIKNWDVSSVTNMSGMFRGSCFNEPIGNWDVSSVTHMTGMFTVANLFNQPLNNWDVSNVTDMSSMFSSADTFNQPLNNWDVSSVTNMDSMFAEPYSPWFWFGDIPMTFNQDISQWDISNVETMELMFCSFHSCYGELNTTDYDKLLNTWSKLPVQHGVLLGIRMTYSPSSQAARDILTDTYGWIIDDRGMAEETPPPVDNPPLTREQLQALVAEWKANPTQENADKISNANVSEITDMSDLFSSDTWPGDCTVSICGPMPIHVNIPIGNWDVSSVTNMSNMFRNNTNFNQDISNWDVSNVTDMSYMFGGKSDNLRNEVRTNFNQDISRWDVSSVTNMSHLFDNNEMFNQDISSWDVSSVTNMSFTFTFTKNFNQALNSWDISSVTNADQFATYSALQDSYNPFMNDTITGQELIQGGGNDNGALSKSAWSHFGNTYGSLERTYNGNTFIYASPRDVGSGMYQSVPTEVGKEYEVKAILIGSDTNYEASHDDTAFNGESYLTIGDAVPTQTKANVFAESEHISDGTETEVSFRFTAQSTTTYLALRSDAQWHYASARALSVKEVDGDTPPPSENPALTREQLQALIAEWKANPTQENADKISNANVSQIMNMSHMFYASDFNQDISSWDVSNVTNMSSMFYGSDFDQDISSWDVSNVTDMSRMFGGGHWSYTIKRGSHFNQPIGDWDVSNVTDMSDMFYENEFFNQPIGNWDVSNVTDMSRMFDGYFGAVAFNQPIGNWDVSNVTEMLHMFAYNFTFNQDISNWNILNVVRHNGFAEFSSLEDSHNPFK